tara:strand:+ start:958 stop:1314 length:357 start_codon:yes stop_codon:yes gene_type:complete
MDDSCILKFKEDLIKTSTDNEIKFNKFYYNSRSYVLVVLFITYYGPRNIATFELACNKIPNSVCSRSTIKKILDQGLKDGFFTKSTDAQDKRKQKYKLTNEYQKLMRNWIKRMKEIFN